MTRPVWSLSPWLCDGPASVIPFLPVNNPERRISGNGNSPVSDTFDCADDGRGRHSRLMECPERIVNLPGGDAGQQSARCLGIAEEKLLFFGKLGVEAHPV